MRKIKDGWHKICGCEVYVEDGYIVRGIKHEGWTRLTAHVYRRDKHYGGWSATGKITPDAFRAGWKRDTIRLY